MEDARKNQEAGERRRRERQAARAEAAARALEQEGSRGGEAAKAAGAGVGGGRLMDALISPRHLTDAGKPSPIEDGAIAAEPPLERAVRLHADPSKALALVGDLTIEVAHRQFEAERR